MIVDPSVADLALVPGQTFDIVLKVYNSSDTLLDSVTQTMTFVNCKEDYLVTPDPSQISIDPLVLGQVAEEFALPIFLTESVTIDSACG